MFGGPSPTLAFLQRLVVAVSGPTQGLTDSGEVVVSVNDFSGLADQECSQCNEIQLILCYFDTVSYGRGSRNM